MPSYQRQKLPDYLKSASSLPSLLFGPLGYGYNLITETLKKKSKIGGTYPTPATTPEQQIKQMFGVDMALRPTSYIEGLDFNLATQQIPVQQEKPEQITKVTSTVKRKRSTKVTAPKSSTPATRKVINVKSLSKSIKKKLRSKGIMNDVQFISYLLPYCDAMFIDNECRGLLKSFPIKDRIQYGTKVFSQNNKDEFIEYLNEIGNQMSEEHFKKVKEVYGDDWLKPYTSLYEKT